jgi:hypothetical protein
MPFISKQRAASYGLRLSPDKKRKLRLLVSEEGTTVNQWIATTIERGYRRMMRTRT